MDIVAVSSGGIMYAYSIVDIFKYSVFSGLDVFSSEIS